MQKISQLMTHGPALHADKRDTNTGGGMQKRPVEPPQEELAQLCHYTQAVLLLLGLRPATCVPTSSLAVTLISAPLLDSG